MRQIFTVLFLLVSQTLLANKIDSIQTDQEALSFLKTLDKRFTSEKYRQVQILPTDSIRQKLSCNGIFDKWQIKNWEKADFNNDGRTDIIITVYWYNFDVFAVIDKGNNTFELLQLSKDVFQNCELAKPFKIGKQQLLVFYRKKREYVKNNKNLFETKEIGQIDTLIYKFGNFVELNKNPSHYKIDSIQFRTSGCLGTCPIYKIEIDKNRNAQYTAIVYNPKQGKFESVLTKESYNKVIQLINYLSIDGLKDDYQVTWTDDQTAWLRIKFSDGTVKEIRDYGLIGTFGLSSLYQLFSELRENQDWKQY